MSDMNTNEQPKWVNNSDAKMAEPLEVNANGGWVYPAQLKEGFEEIEIPALLPGSTTNTESMHMNKFGAHVASKIESSMKTGYLRKQGPAQVFAHYVGCAEGASLLTGDALTHMKELSKEFAEVPEQAEYYRQVISPWLQSLSPQRRR